MIIGKSKRELEKMRAAGRLVAEVREELRRMVRPGVTTLELDMAAEKMIRDAGAIPTFKGYHGFPFSICASVNEQVVHGFPSAYELKEGDIFSLDCGVTLGGFVGDTATTVPVGEVDEDKLKLIQVTEECLERAIQQCRVGNHLGDIGWAVQQRPSDDARRPDVHGMRRRACTVPALRRRRRRAATRTGCPIRRNRNPDRRLATVARDQPHRRRA